MTDTHGYMTAERRMIQEAARDFALDEVLPAANKLDPVDGAIPRSIRDKMGELGYFGILIPEEFGGLGLGCFEYCLVAEELARAWMSVSSLIARGNSFYKAIGATTPEGRRERIARMARGEYLGALAMSEPQTGSDVASLKTRARREGDEWVVSGAKYWCTFADGADFLYVMARTSDEPAKHRGITGIVMEKPRGELPRGVSGQPVPKIGYRGWKTWELSFDAARAPVVVAQDQIGKGFYSVLNMMETARAHTAARAIGLARGAMEDAIAYAMDRTQFGRPIAEFQAIRFKLAHMAAEIEAARQLMYAVCDAIDRGQRCDREAAMAKYFATEMAERATSEALQIFGGAGYTTLHAVERYWRDARLTKIFEGSSEIQLRIISDHLLGKVAETG